MRCRRPSTEAGLGGAGSFSQYLARSGVRAGRRAGAVLVAVIVAAAGALASPATATATATASDGDGPVVTVRQGRLQGVEKRGVDRFLGIPYAAPPKDQLRWRPPQPVRHWPGTRPAKAMGPRCPQSVEFGKDLPESEDCLFLNVYTPARPSHSPRPVLVWIHGGSLVSGSGNDYDGSALAARGSVVVTINYRLGALGFLALGGLSEESPDAVSGQYGLMDQQAALRWVRENAGAFGGDRDNVTVFGESAGGGSICDHLASPPAAGLFQRAIAQSVCVTDTPEQTTAKLQGADFASQAGCGSANEAACLRDLPVHAIMRNQGRFGWSPAYGGPLLPEPVRAAVRAGRVHHVPVIAGTTHDEGTFFVYLLYPEGLPLPSDFYRKAIAHHFRAGDRDQVVQDIMDRYPLDMYEGDPRKALSAALGDGAFSCAVNLSNKQLASRQPVHAYEFNDHHPVDSSDSDFRWWPNGPLGAYHGSELPYVFQRKLGQGDTGKPAFNRAQQVLSDTMAGYWSRFAATGTPNGDRAPHWPRFTTAAPSVQSLSPGVGGVRPESDFSAEHQCGFWEPLWLRKDAITVNLGPLPELPPVPPDQFIP
ncbi:carboxylesterase/lipase family protein [Streptomyces sp. NPDC020777]